jgi:calcineurin-like phosphoesterase
LFRSDVWQLAQQLIGSDLLKAATINLMRGTKIDKMNCPFFRSDEYITAIDIQMNDIFFMDFTKNAGQADSNFEF